MTKQEALSYLKKLEYKYISSGLLLTDLMTYKPENFEVLRECKKEMPELKMYESECKFRLVYELIPSNKTFEPNNNFNNESGIPF